jgi:2-polyprenyl-6-methoxyphenol hydroxylase-like FAD-dependent oxidoreductase
MARTADVLVVGAGPTGLMVAGELAAAGVACTVLERRTDESNLTRAFAVHARALELLDACGMADELVATGQRVDSVQALGGLRVDLSRLPTRFPYVLVTPQYQTERILAARAKALGVEIVRGAEVVGLHQDDGGVTVEVAGRDDHRAGYMIGTDGVGSTVRRLAGLPFPGRSAVRSVMLADVRLAQPPPEVLTADAAGDDFVFLAPFGDGWYRVIAWNRRNQLPDDAPVDPAELRAITRRVLGTDHGMGEPRWTSRFHSDERQVPRYRVGRVFLAGDAAHVHSPVGGQGMNTGLQDAGNLGWKLAGAVHGWAPDRLLETYHSERYPVGRAVIRGSAAGLRVAFGLSPLARLARPVLSGVAGRLGRVPRRVPMAVSGIGIAYPANPGDHRLAGRRAPDVALLPEPGRLYEALRARRFVLVTSSDRLATLAARWGGRIEVAPPAALSEAGPPRTGSAVADREATDVAASGGTSMLVRPDGYVAWATDDPGHDSAYTAFTWWCGPPVTGG